MQRKVIVIGAGLGGMAVAIRLASKGFDVSVFEKNTYVGGKITEYILEPEKGMRFRFDAGPSLFTLPEVFDALFFDAGKDPRNYFNYVKLDSSCRYFYEDGTTIDAFSDPEKFAGEIELKTEDKHPAVLKFFRHVHGIYSITKSIFLERSLHKLSSYFRWQTLISFLRFYKIDAFVPMEKALRRYFKDPRTIQLFSRFATYNGSSPYKAPGTLNVIAHIEHSLGAYEPVGGIHLLTKAIKKLADDLQVKFYLGEQVEQINYSGKKVSGIRSPLKEYESDIVISNMDIFHTYKKLLPGIKPPSMILNQAKSTSALIFYWAMKRDFPDLQLHNIFFSGDYNKEFDCMDRGEISNDPTVYINITSKFQEGDAPRGMENWFVMINVPNNSGQDWDTLISNAKQHIVLKLGRLLKVDILQQILEKKIQVFVRKLSIYLIISLTIFALFKTNGIPPPGCTLPPQKYRSFRSDEKFL